ncbi:MAG TPA: response regulator [Alphaproteobacteria bacterium]
MSKILIIDDDPLICEVLRRAAEDAGHTVATARNGRLGLENAIAFRPDVVVTDIYMPEKEGLETIVDLRKLSPDLPIIAMSGAAAMGTSNVLELAKKLGASQAFTKPLPLSDLMGAISALCTLTT